MGSVRGRKPRRVRNAREGDGMEIFVALMLLNVLVLALGCAS